MDNEIPAFNLLTDEFFPVRTLSGARRWVRFEELRLEDGDFPVAFDWPRADLNIATYEFAIGVLALAYQPEDHADWIAIWRGHSEIDLGERLAALAFAFNLTGDADGNGPRFQQDFEAIEGEASDIDALFIDTPGVNGQKKNADVLTHRGRFPALGLKAAAIALYALQQFAPSGGKGNRTSLRGGGPMTTLVWPDRPGSASPAPLWRVLLANLPLSAWGAGYLDDHELARALPWLKPTITSEGKPPDEVSQTDPRAHPLQAFFGMPRRIRLVVNGNGICALTGETGPIVTGFIQRPWGMNYGAWRHPLTPYRQAKESEPPYSVKPKTSRFGYRDWVGVVVGRQEKAHSAFRAEPVAELSRRAADFRRGGLASPRMLAAGWAMNNMEAVTFLQSMQPLYLAEDEAKAAQIARLAKDLANAGEAAANLLSAHLKLALFGKDAKIAIDTGVFEQATDALFERTEDPFHAVLEAVIADASCEDQQHRLRWLAILRRTTLDLFDLHATTLLAEANDIKVAMRVTDAYRRLRSALGNVGKLAAALGIQQPVGDDGPKNPAMQRRRHTYEQSI